MRKILTFFISFLPIYVIAQWRDVEGFVRDSATAEPLTGATVFVSQACGTLSNERGYFKLRMPSDSQYILVSYLAYHSEKFAVRNGIMEIQLVAQSRFLEPVVISATKEGQREVETTVSVSSIQPYLIQNRITGNIENTMQQIPGVSITDGQANIRSGSGWSYGTGSRVSVLVDGMPMLASGTGQAQWSFFPIENIRQVEVIKGSSSVLYGSSALNGVIHILTDWPGNKEKISASLYSGFFGEPANSTWKWQGKRLLTQSGGHVLYGKGKDRYQYIFSINGLLDEGYRMGDQDKHIRLSGKTRYFSKDKQWIYGLNSNVLFGKKGTFLLWENYDLAYTSLDSAYGLNKTSRLNIDPYLEYHGSLAEHYVQFRFYKVDNSIEQIVGEPDQSNTTQSLYSEYRIKWKRWQALGLTLNTGLVSVFGETNANIFQGKKIQQNQAAYLQADFKKGRWNASAGARYEHYRLENYQEGKPVFKAGLNYRVAKATYLRASFGQGFRFPVVSEAFIQTSSGPVSIFPNENLKSESGNSMEIGFRQGFKTKSGLQWMADLAFFRMYYENMMEFTFAQWGIVSPGNPFGLGFKSVNIGPSRIQGMEFSLSGGGSWRKNEIHLLAGYTYSNPQNLQPDLVYAKPLGVPFTYKSTSTDTSGKILKYRNRHLIKADLQVERTRWGAGVSYRYASRFEAIDQAFLLLIQGVDKSIEANKKGDHVIDLRLFYHLKADLKITFIVNNLLNEEVLSRPADIGPPRSFKCQLSYKY